MRLLLLGLVTVMVVALSSCNQGDVVVSRDMKRTADTLYRNQRTEILPSLDSACAVYKVAQYDHLLDSIIQMRKKERDQILRR